MENEITKYPIFAFEVDGNGRTGVVLVAAKDEKQAYQHIVSLTLFRHYRIHFHKEVNYIKYETDILNIVNTVVSKQKLHGNLGKIIRNSARTGKIYKRIKPLFLSQFKSFYNSY